MSSEKKAFENLLGSLRYEASVCLEEESQEGYVRYLFKEKLELRADCPYSNGTCEKIALALNLDFTPLNLNHDQFTLIAEHLVEIVMNLTKVLERRGWVAFEDAVIKEMSTKKFNVII